MEQIIEDNKDYVRVNGSFIVNRNEKDYQAALLRRKTSNQLKELETRVTGLESKLDQIIRLLSEKN
ncbi:MAG: hypothetical protein ACPLYF_03035 [Fervidobacterium sp.]|jgi:BMFP domain-containing protein YqiC